MNVFGSVFGGSAEDGKHQLLQQQARDLAQQQMITTAQDHAWRHTQCPHCNGTGKTTPKMHDKNGNFINIEILSIKD